MAGPGIEPRPLALESDALHDVPTALRGPVRKRYMYTLHILCSLSLLTVLEIVI